MNDEYTGYCHECGCPLEPEDATTICLRCETMRNAKRLADACRLAKDYEAIHLNGGIGYCIAIKTKAHDAIVDALAQYDASNLNTEATNTAPHLTENNP
jgi:hypothetical protein